MADLSRSTVSRRRFIGVGAGVAGVVTFGGFGLLAGCEATLEPAPPGTNPARNRLKLPTALMADGVTLAAATGMVDIGGGRMAGVHTYNGGFPGPTLMAKKGELARFTLVNDLAEETTIHSHGLIAPTVADGQPMHAVAPGASFTYEFPVVQRASMNFYHPHPHLLTGKQVNLGLAGVFMVVDDEELALDLPPRSIREVPLVLRDASFDKSGNLAYKAANAGFTGSTPLVNGTIDPALGVDTALYRFRVLNASNARVMRLRLSDGTPFTLIGNDGGLLASAVQVNEIIAAPAERFDLLVDLRHLGLGDRIYLRDLNSGWDLLELEVTRVVKDTRAVPTGTLSTIDPLGTPLRTRQFSFDGHFRINGVIYDMHHPPAFSIPFGETELWRFTTGGNAPHPVHVHGAHFQVQSRTGGRNQLYPWEAGWKDTVLLENNETVDVLVRFDEHRGEYLMHCHQLEHEDNGMMLAFEVV